MNRANSRSQRGEWNHTAGDPFQIHTDRFDQRNDDQQKNTCLQNPGLSHPRNLPQHRPPGARVFSQPFQCINGIATLWS